MKVHDKNHHVVTDEAQYSEELRNPVPVYGLNHDLVHNDMDHK